MKYSHQPIVLPELAAESKRDIEAVNEYIDRLKGVVISVEHIRSGQQRAYGDSVYESLISCHIPNSLTTNAPNVRTITRAQAEQLARIFVRDWEDNPKFLEARLVSLTPEPNPWGLKEYSTQLPEERSACWRVIVREPYND